MDDSVSIDMPTVPGVELLQRAPLFAKLGFEETMELARISHLEVRKDGDVLIHQDSLGGALYVLKSGAAKVFFHESHGDVRELATLKQGDLFGEMTLIDDQLASADVVAVGPVELVVIPRSGFDRLLEDNRQLAVKVYRCFCRSLTDKLRKANARIAELGHTHAHAEHR